VKVIEAMGSLNRIRLLMRALFRRAQAEQDLDEELRYHLNKEAQRNIASGMTPEEARRAALRSLGGLEQVKEECREARGVQLIHDTSKDVRYGLRMLRRNPGFTLVAVISLGLAIGANTTVFTLVDAMLLKMLPVKNPQELVLFTWVSGPKLMARAVWGPPTYDQDGRRVSNTFSYAAFRQFQDQHSTLSDLFAFQPLEQLNVRLGADAEIASGQLVSGEYYTGLGVHAALGRLVDASDDRTGAASVAVISHAYWQRRFGRDPAVVGATIEINNTPFTVIGVAPSEFHGTLEVGSDPDLSIPLTQEPLVRAGGPENSSLGDPSYWWLNVMGRLKPGVSAEQARASMEAIFQQSAAEGWSASGEPGGERDLPRLKLTSGSQGLTELRKEYSHSLLILVAIVGLVLLAACANVANLMLARAASRQKEFTVRMALGAGRLRMIRQLLTESILLSGLGAAIGLLLANWGRDLLLTLRPWGGDKLTVDLKLDARVLGFLLGAALVTGVLFGLAPALRATKVDLTPSLKEGSKALGLSRSALRKALIVAQVAMSLLLLISAGLFIRTLRNLHHVEAGFDPVNVALFRVDPRLSGYKGEQIGALYERMTERIGTVAGVRGVTFSRHALLAGSWADSILTIPGRPESSGEDNGVHRLMVGPNFFGAMGIPLLRGRSVTGHEDASSGKVAVINKTLAQRFFPGEDPVGQRFIFGRLLDPKAAPDPGRVIEIVGVVGDVKYRSLRQPVPPTVYEPAAQSGIGQMAFEVRTEGDPGRVIPGIRAAVREVDSKLPLFELTTQADLAEESLARERLFARLTGAFGLMAAVLASIGLYGVMAYSVTRRTQEFGVRVALGAQRGNILGMVMREALVLAGLGVLIGLGAALSVTRLVASLLYGLSANDPATIACATLLMITVSALASWLPARRATRVNPIEALRYE
jgi:predicted permease